jgi:hypothetical protein
MNRIMIVLGCLLGLALACIPAYASPTHKNITVTCTSSDGNEVITGDATVTLCATLATCTKQFVVCPQILCDSSGTNQPISITVSCDAPFKVGGLTAQIDFLDSEGHTAGSSPSVDSLTGKGFSTSVAPNPNDTTDPDADGDTEAVSLTVK